MSTAGMRPGYHEAQPRAFFWRGLLESKNFFSFFGRLGQWRQNGNRAIWSPVYGTSVARISFELASHLRAFIVGSLPEKRDTLSKYSVTPSIHTNLPLHFQYHQCSFDSSTHYVPNSFGLAPHFSQLRIVYPLQQPESTRELL